MSDLIAEEIQNQQDTFGGMEEDEVPLPDDYDVYHENADIDDVEFDDEKKLEDGEYKTRSEDKSSHDAIKDGGQEDEAELEEDEEEETLSAATEEHSLKPYRNIKIISGDDRITENRLQMTEAARVIAVMAQNFAVNPQTFTDCKNIDN